MNAVRYKPSVLWAVRVVSFIQCFILSISAADSSKYVLCVIPMNAEDTGNYLLIKI